MFFCLFRLEQEPEEPGAADDPPIPSRPVALKAQAQQAPDAAKWSAHEGHSAADGHHAGPQPTEVVSPPDLIDNAHVTEGLSLADPPIVETAVSCCPSPASCPCRCCGAVLSSASRLARHMLVHSLRCDDPAPQLQRGHKRRHLSAVSSSLAPARPPSSAPIFSCLNLIAGSHLEELNRSRQVAGPCFSFGSSPSSSSSSRSRHHSSEMMALAEDLRSRPSSRNQGPLSLIFPNSGPSPLTSSGVLDGSFGSLAPGVAVLASLMGGGGGGGNGVDSLSATDLSLGSVMFPSVRLATSQTGQSIGGDTQVPVGHVATASAAPPFANLSLQSYSAAAAALALSTHSTPSSSSGASSVVASSNCSISSSSSSGQQSVPVASCATTSSASANLRSAPPALCKFCGKSFVELGALMAHLPFHTGERPFRCDFCGKAFKLRHHMKDHARVHTGERPFPCRLCGKTFSRSTILKAHEKTHLPKAERSGALALPPVSPTS